MLRIISRQGLKELSETSAGCHEAQEPVLVTESGSGDIAFMSYIYTKLSAAEEQVTEGKVFDGDVALKQLRDKYKLVE